MFNLDMIGRNDVGQMSMLGKYQYPKLFKIVDDVNKKAANFELNFNVESSVRNSDQFPFMRANVPVAFFISGLHDQYHTPRDTVDRIITEKVEKVAQMVFLALWETANLPAGTSLK
jgi:Zn-dependent M28 family amino/carboxypeptidase